MTRTFIFPLFCICLAAATWPQSAQAADDQPDSATPTIMATHEGSRTVVFESPKDACNDNDIPDSMARAFRDYEGTVHIGGVELGDVPKPPRDFSVDTGIIHYRGWYYAVATAWS